MKILGQLIILFTGLIFGMWGVKREEKYISLIEELQLGLSIVENEISFSLKPLPASFTQAAKSLKTTKAFFTEAAKRATEGEACLFNLDLIPLKENEKNILFEVGVRLGRGSDREQITLVLKAISRLEESRQTYREKLKRVSPLWRWLSPLAALLVVLLSC